jgi:hypothetical protein
MPRFSETQSLFASAVRDAKAPVPGTVTSHSAPRPLRRFNVYRNNFYVSLIDMLAGRYPVVQRLVGEEFFRAMAKAFIEEQPPRSALILSYGGGFADFLSSFPPVADVPYLPDIARLEWARHMAYHAADATPLGVKDFAAIPAEKVAALTLSLHPSLSVVASAFPIVAIWETNTADEQVRPINTAAGGEDALVLRPHMSVEVRRLPPGAALFIGGLSKGHTLGEAFEATLAAEPAFDLAVNLAGLLSAGAIIAYQHT